MDDELSLEGLQDDESYQNLRRLALLAVRGDDIETIPISEHKGYRQLGQLGQLPSNNIDNDGFRALREEYAGDDSVHAEDVLKFLIKEGINPMNSKVIRIPGETVIVTKKSRKILIPPRKQFRPTAGHNEGFVSYPVSGFSSGSYGNILSLADEDGTEELSEENRKSEDEMEMLKRLVEQRLGGNRGNEIEPHGQKSHSEELKMDDDTIDPKEVKKLFRQIELDDDVQDNEEIAKAREEMRKMLEEINLEDSNIQVLNAKNDEMSKVLLSDPSVESWPYTTEKTWGKGFFNDETDDMNMKKIMRRLKSSGDDLKADLSAQDSKIGAELNLKMKSDEIPSTSFDLMGGLLGKSEKSKSSDASIDQEIDRLLKEATEKTY